MSHPTPPRPPFRHILDTDPGTPSRARRKPAPDDESIYVRLPEQAWERTTQTLPGTCWTPD